MTGHFGNGFSVLAWLLFLTLAFMLFVLWPHVSVLSSWHPYFLPSWGFCQQWGVDSLHPPCLHYPLVVLELKQCKLQRCGDGDECLGPHLPSVPPLIRAQGPLLSTLGQRAVLWVARMLDQGQIWVPGLVLHWLSQESDFLSLTSHYSSIIQIGQISKQKFCIH